MEILFTLDEYSDFKNSLNEYYSEIATEDKKEFKAFLGRISKTTKEEQRELEGKLMSFMNVRITPRDLERAVTSLAFVYTVNEADPSSNNIKSVLDRLNSILKCVQIAS